MIHSSPQKISISLMDPHNKLDRAYSRILNLMSTGERISREQTQKKIREIFLMDNKILVFKEGKGLIVKQEISKDSYKSDPLTTGICGKQIRSGEIVYHCQDCAQDHAAFICVDCFENGNHEGHNFEIIRNPEKVMCDCGDVEALDKHGFCNHHNGIITEVNPDFVYDYSMDPSLIESI